MPRKHRARRAFGPSLARGAGGPRDSRGPGRAVGLLDPADGPRRLLPLQDREAVPPLMRSDAPALSVLLPLWKRPGGLLDLVLFLVLADLADRRGIVQSKPGQPLTYAFLGALIARDGYHGVPSFRPNRKALARAVKRLEGIPGDPRFPRYLWADSTPRRDLIFQIALGRGKLRPEPAGVPADVPGCKPAKPANTRVSGSYPVPGVPARGPLSIDGSSIEENARERPVDKARARELLRQSRAVLRSQEGRRDGESK